MPRRLSAAELAKLNPNDPHDARIIDAEWRRQRARRMRKAQRAGWVRVVAVIATYIVLAWLIIGLVYVIAIVLLAYAGTN